MHRNSGLTTKAMKLSAHGVGATRRAGVRLAVLGLAPLAMAAAAHGAAYTWGGGTLGWNNTSASGWNGGPPVAGDTATISSGVISFVQHDTFGNSQTASSAAITINTGGILSSGGFFNTLWNLNLNGGTLAANGGPSADYPAFNLAGTVTSGAGFTSNITVGSGSNNAINLGNGNSASTTTFNVGADGVLNVANALRDHRYTSPVVVATASLTKTGAGKLVLAGASDYLGATTVSAGELEVTGSLTGAASLIGGGQFRANGGTLTFNNSAATTTFQSDAFGNAPQVGVNGTTGVLNVKAGTVRVVTNSGSSWGSLNLGVNTTGNPAPTGTINVSGGSLQIAGRILMAANGGSGASATLNLTGGEVVMGTAGNYTTSGDPQNGVLWFGTGKAVVNLDGGTLNMFGTNDNGTQPGSGFNFNGGTLKAVANNDATFTIFSPNMKATVKSGGAKIDTQSFNVTFDRALEHDAALGSTADGGLTKSGTGRLRLTKVNTYTGDTLVSAGTLELTSTSSLAFVIGASGVNNEIDGAGTLLASGAFALDLTNASTTVGSSWNLVNVGTLSETFGSSFALTGFSAIGSDLWTKPIDPSRYYQFSEGTGILSVQAVPEPTTLAGLALISLTALKRRR